MWNIIFLTTGAMLIELLLFVFFHKKVIDNTENLVFKALIITNCFEYLSEIPLQLFVRGFGADVLIVDIFSKIYLATLFTYYSFFTVYTFTICLNKNNEEKYKKHFKLNKRINIIVSIIGLLTILALPFSKFYDGDKMYIYGDAVEVFKLFAGIYMLVWIVLLIINFKKMKEKKYYPIYLVILLGLVSNIIQNHDPSILIASMIGTIACYTMFFTIENPDMKLIQELHTAKEISDNANEEKTLFLYNMTQEIRNITKKIDDDADIILDSKDWEETRNSARNIKSNTSRFTNMTNDILDVGSIDETNLKIYNSKYSIKTIIKQLVNVYGDICKNKELKFITNIDHDIPETLYGDSINLKEVLNTILENSIKYTEKGYIEFDVNTIVKNDICRLIFTIEDSGIGIKSENINKIKLDNKSLSKANQLITVMNGTMLISSDYGTGTKVKIILDQKIENSEDKVVTKYESSLEKLNILAIDDSEAGLKIISKLLKDNNITLDVVNNGKDSLEMIQVNKYDVILLDEELTSISGKELLTKIKEIRNFNTPVILLTKDNNYEYNEEYKNEGFTDYVLKPLKRNILLEVINKYTKKDQ